MSAVRREQPQRLPSTPGSSGALITEASIEQLEACVRADNVWLFGGRGIGDYDEPVETIGFLGDRSRNPDGHETVDAFLASTSRNSVNHRAVRRVHERITAIEAELAHRREEQHAESNRRQQQALAKLASWREGSPARVAEFQRCAGEVLAAWAVVEPIYRALELLQAPYPSAQGDIPTVYGRLCVQEAEIAAVLGQMANSLPDLPPGLPTFEQIKDASNVLRTTQWASTAVPRTGLEHIALERTLRAARGES